MLSRLCRIRSIVLIWYLLEINELKGVICHRSQFHSIQSLLRFYKAGEAELQIESFSSTVHINRNKAQY